MNKVVIFGSTGMTGLCAVEAAVKKGLNVRAFVRDPAKLPENLKSSVEVVQGDVLSYNDVLNAIKGVNGVVVVLGTRNDLKPTTALSEGMKNIIKAMKEANVEVVSVCLSAFLFYEPEKVPPMFKDLNADHQRQFDALKESSLKYIAILPPHIADQPGSDYEVKHDASPGRAISKYDLGRFLVDSLSQPEHYGKVCGICTKH
ncbi:flavin reductase (NADPH) [Tribolium castaneum]|uniref:Flavin reductase (NADPH)-like Protein n=1 Tax=Tribolium castaneum TaxID=7070 RepID=D6WR30_TRICA|nr:PREDICTED: flavin reductase (NADPH) [Tribolium castaneum]EFA07011.1 Flavin reductase (NADPH)-like Protein [Tribolium castaneum]|eukprot:XP_975411.1 PREDICTED: flavin reductase (NADPH) [Tribolium castaneum]